MSHPFNSSLGRVIYCGRSNPRRSRLATMPASRRSLPQVSGIPLMATPAEEESHYSSSYSPSETSEEREWETGEDMPLAEGGAAKRTAVKGTATPQERTDESRKKQAQTRQFGFEEQQLSQHSFEQVIDKHHVVGQPGEEWQEWAPGLRAAQAPHQATTQPRPPKPRPPQPKPQPPKPQPLPPQPARVLSACRREQRQRHVATRDAEADLKTEEVAPLSGQQSPATDMRVTCVALRAGAEAGCSSGFLATPRLIAQDTGTEAGRASEGGGRPRGRAFGRRASGKGKGQKRRPRGGRWEKERKRRVEGRKAAAECGASGASSAAFPSRCAPERRRAGSGAAARTRELCEALLCSVCQELLEGHVSQCLNGLCESCSSALRPTRQN